MSLRVYVAAPYPDAPQVRAIHEDLRAGGLAPTSVWAEEADGPEDLLAMPLEEIRRRAERNDRALAASDVVVVLPRVGAGREMYGEARLAVALGVPVVWVGSPVCLTTFREGVTRVDSLGQATALLLSLAAARAAA
jgi:hypothetical protein